MDPRLSHVDVRVFNGISSYVTTGQAYTLSYGEIAESSAVSRRQVIRSVQKLIQFDHIEVIGERRESAPRAYRLRSPVFKASQQVAEQGPASSKRLRCGECKRAVKGIGAAGLCRKCVADAEMEVRIRGALLVLGAAATPEAIYEHLHVEKGAAAIRRVLLRMERAA